MDTLFYHLSYHIISYFVFRWGSLVMLTAGVSLAQLAAHQKAQVSIPLYLE